VAAGAVASLIPRHLDLEIAIGGRTTGQIHGNDQKSKARGYHSHNSRVFGEVISDSDRGGTEEH
jgi:hypothetical protein